MQRFTTESMTEIFVWVESMVAVTSAGDIIEFLIQNPDDDYETHRVESPTHHSWRALGDLAILNSCRMMTPHRVESGEVIVRLQRLDIHNSFHDDTIGDPREKYGVDSPFATLGKIHEPAFYYYYREALKKSKIEKRATLLNLGINSGYELGVIRDMLPRELFQKMKLTGIDYSASAINQAKLDFPHSNVSLLCHDVNWLHQLNLGRYDLIISIGTLQSPNIDFKLLFMSLIQKYLTPTGAVILGFPNCRWIDGEMIYGAKAPNYSYSEMSLLIKDIYFCKKYLQQHKFRVTITGKEYLFLTATKIGVDRR